MYNATTDCYGLVCCYPVTAPFFFGKNPRVYVLKNLPENVNRYMIDDNSFLLFKKNFTPTCLLWFYLFAFVFLFVCLFVFVLFCFVLFCFFATPVGPRENRVSDNLVPRVFLLPAPSSSLATGGGKKRDPGNEVVSRRHQVSNCYVN